MLRSMLPVLALLTSCTARPEVVVRTVYRVTNCPAVAVIKHGAQPTAPDRQIDEPDYNLLGLVGRPDVSSSSVAIVTRMHRKMVEARRAGNLKKANEIASVLNRVVPSIK